MSRKVSKFIKQLFSDISLQVLQACGPIGRRKIPAAFCILPVCSRPECIRWVIGSVRQAGGC